MDSISSTAHAFAEFFSHEPKLVPIIELLYQHMQLGHVCLDLKGEHFDDYTINNIKIFGTAIDNQHPFILHKGKLYTHRNFNYQLALIQQIDKMIQDVQYSDNQYQLLLNVKPSIPDNFFNKTEIIDWQSIACVNSFLNRFSIISGGPGTGKTTSVAKLLYLELLANPSANIKLVAPTGKAAIRLKDSLGNIELNFDKQRIKYNTEITSAIKSIPTSTIHQLLGYQPNKNQFKHHQHNPLPIDILIIDECSMIDLNLFSKTLQAIDAEKTKIILLGDYNQLAAVEAGSIMGDLCTLHSNINQFTAARAAQISSVIGDESIPVADEAHTLQNQIVSLQKSHRFDDNKGIGKFSKAVLNNDIESITEIFNTPDKQIQFQTSSETAVRYYLDFILNNQQESYLYEQDIHQALIKINNIKLLCSTRLGKFGVQQINQTIDQAIRLHYRQHATQPIYENQLIMVNKNQADLNIYNGDIGIIRSVQQGDGSSYYMAHFLGTDKSIIQLLPGQITQWESAHAMTIHKSQGSEYEEVIILLPEENQLTTKELLYTALTRAKNKAIILSDLETILKVSSKSINRISGISDYFN